MSPQINQRRLAHEAARLRPLIEQIVADQCRLASRGLAFLVDAVETKGRPPERIQVWGTLHFLPLGSPFCCLEPQCHLGLFADRLERVSETLRHRLHLQQAVALEFMAVGTVCHEGVEFDDWGTGRPPSLDWYDIDRRDALGRTALMRAAQRGHEQLVEELLEAGADPNVRDRQGRSLLETPLPGQIWLRTLLESALSKPKRQ